jgi:thiamine transporter ThiT
MSDKVKGIIFFGSLAVAGLIEVVLAITPANDIVPMAIVGVVEMIIAFLTGHNFIWPKVPNTIRNTE